ncbi:hypothetical protein OG960_24985 [Streptomyces sp. NBC_00280]
MLSAVNADGSTPNGARTDEIVREGARRMLWPPRSRPRSTHMAELAGQWDGDGRRLVVRNGYHQPRQVTTVGGTVEVKAPRVNDKRVDEVTGERKRFSSAILPAWCRKSPKVSEGLPLLCLQGLSSVDFVPVLEQFLGSSAGLSPATVTRLTQQWQALNKIIGDVDELPAFYDFPAEHWIHLRPSNPIESTSATVRFRTKITKVAKVAGSPAAALAMVFKLVESAQARWRAVNTPHLVALVRAGTRFERGHLVERAEAVTA